MCSILGEERRNEETDIEKAHSMDAFDDVDLYYGEEYSYSICST